eukprot:6207293-Pleurochrysis_carterae.AAC.5
MHRSTPWRHSSALTAGQSPGEAARNEDLSSQNLTHPLKPHRLERVDLESSGQITRSVIRWPETTQTQAHYASAFRHFESRDFLKTRVRARLKWSMALSTARLLKKWPPHQRSATTVGQMKHD